MLDKIDRKILTILQSDGRITNADLAEQVNLSPTPCLKRVRRLEENGVITGHKAEIDPEKVGYNILGLVLLKIGDTTREAVDAFGKAIQKMSAVTECYMAAGRTDYVARIYVKDFHDYESIVKDELARLPNINSIETLFLFSNVVEDNSLKLK